MHGAAENSTCLKGNAKTRTDELDSALWKAIGPCRVKLDDEKLERRQTGKNPIMSNLQEGAAIEKLNHNQEAGADLEFRCI